MSHTWMRIESGTVLGAVGPAEERGLYERMVAGDNTARDRLIEASIGLVMRATEGQAQREDLIQECLTEISRKMTDFDPAKGRLSTFLMPWIQKTIGEWDDKNRAVCIPRNRGEEMRRLRKAYAELSLGTNERPSLDAVAERAGLDVEKARLAQDNFERWGQEESVLSLNAPVGEGTMTLMDRASQSLGEESVTSRVHSDIEIAVEALPESERRVIKAAFGFDRGTAYGATLAEISEAWNMPMQEVRKAYRRGMSALNVALSPHGAKVA